MDEQVGYDKVGQDKVIVKVLNHNKRFKVKYYKTVTLCVIRILKREILEMFRYNSTKCLSEIEGK